MPESITQRSNRMIKLGHLFINLDRVSFFERSEGVIRIVFEEKHADVFDANGTRTSYDDLESQLIIDDPEKFQALDHWLHSSAEVIL